MSSAVKQGWETTPPSVGSLTVTGLATLATGSSASSAAIDNYSSAAANWKITIGTGSSATGFIEIYYKGSLDNTTFPDDTNDVLVDVINANVDSTTFNKTLHLASRLGGVIDPYFKIRYSNKSGAAFTAATISSNRGDAVVG
jgi:hypothetical protein